MLLLALLLPTVTGWSGDSCCPMPENAAGQGCVAAGVCAPPASAGEPSADGEDNASHRSIFCSCVSCGILFAHTSRPALDAPDHIGRVVPDSISIPPAVYLPGIFRPPLA